MVEFSFAAGCLTGLGLRFPAACGANGVTAHKYEGDNATPAGLLTLTRVLYRADRLRAPDCTVPVEPLGPHDGWCDAPADPAYNRPIRLPHPARHEVLWRADGLYDIIGVLDWNRAPIIPGRGSAIFLHIAAPGLAPTAGCIALAPPDLLACLRAGLDSVRVL